MYACIYLLHDLIPIKFIFIGRVFLISNKYCKDMTFMTFLSLIYYKMYDKKKDEKIQLLNLSQWRQPKKITNVK